MHTGDVEINGRGVRVHYEGRMAYVRTDEVFGLADSFRKVSMALFLNRMLEDGYAFVAEIRETLYFRK